MTDKVGEFFRSYWMPIAFAIAVAVAWGGSTAQIAMIGAGQQAIGAKIDHIAEDLAAEKATLAAHALEFAELQARVHDLEASHR